MNTRSTSKLKSADDCKTKSKNTDAEVFVLPPNLLEKLGIKLDKIQSTENSSTDPKNILDQAVNNCEDNQNKIYETNYVNTEKPCTNESESSILETASLMKESVFLSPTFVPTIANAIPGEVEIASIPKEFKNNSQDRIQEFVDIEEKTQSLSSEQELLNKFESVNTAQSESLKNTNGNCFFDIKNNCEYHEPPSNMHEFIETENILDQQKSQGSLNKESENISIKLNENQENKKNKINIINDEIIDIAKMNRLLNFDNNNVLTPVSVGMLLPPTKAFTITFGSNESKVPESGCSQPQKNDTNFEKCEPNCVNVGNNDDNSHTDVPLVKYVSNCGNGDQYWDDTVYHENNHFNNVELCPSIPNAIDADVENLKNLSTELKEDAQSKTNLTDNFFNNIHDQNSLYCPVFTKSDMSPETSNDHQQYKNTDQEIKSRTNTININDILIKKDVDDDCNESCNSITKINVCSVEQNKQGCNVETRATLASNIFPCNGNETVTDSENGKRKSKLCIQGVEKPGGISKNSIKNVSCNSQKVNEPKPEIKNKKQTTEIIQSDEYLQKNIQVMKSLKTYKRKRLMTNALVQNSKNEANLNTNEADENQINGIVIDTVCRKAEYCLCSDFGQLRFYDEDSFYEHIHFWQHNNITCKPDLIFSMYADNVTNEYDEDSTVEILDETSEESSHKICWNEVCYDGDEIHLDKNNSSALKMKKSNKHVDSDQKSINVEMSETENNNVIEKYAEGVKSGNSPNTSLMSNAAWVKEDANKVKDEHKSRKTNKARDSEKSSDKSKAGYVNEVVNINKIENAKKVCGVNKGDDVKKVLDVNKVEIANKVGDKSKVKDKYKVVDSNKAEDANKAKDISKFENESVKTGKKRRRSFRVTKEEEESSLDPAKPFSKKDVKCGVCGQILTRQEWEEHLNKEHGFVAWKVGDIFDSQNKQMIINVERKLKDGVLKCPYCTSTFNHSEEYISHVYDCTKNKVPCSSQVIKSNSSTLFTTMESKMRRRLSKSCNDVEHTSTEVDSSRTMEIDTTDTLTCLVEEKTMKTDESYKNVKSNTGNLSLGQQSMKSVSPNKLNIDTTTVLTTSPKVVNYDYDDSHEKVEINPEMTSTPLLQGKSLKVDNSSDKMFFTYSKCMNRESFKKMDTNIKDTLTPSVREELLNCADTPIKGDIDTISISNSLLQEKPTKRRDYTKKINIDSKSNTTAQEVTVKCGVCKEEIKDNLWIDHMQKAHNYLAWKDGESSLDIDDENLIWQHLYLISKKCNGLVCSKCGLSRKYVKAYLSHIKRCDGIENSTKADTFTNVDINDKSTSTLLENLKHDESSQEVEGTARVPLGPSEKEKTERSYSPTKVDHESKTTLNPLAEKELSVKCGVCKQEMDDNHWNDHMQKAHNYLAWKEGENSLNQQDKDQIWQHLHSISIKCGGLICPKCGLNRKYVKSYLNHTKLCDGMDDSTEVDSSKNMETDIATSIITPVKENVEKCNKLAQEVKNRSTLTPSYNQIIGKCDDSHIKVEDKSRTACTPLSEKVIVNCGVCKQEMDDSLWKDHIQTQHNYLAWKEGEISLDLQDKDQIWQHLHSISKKYDGLVCFKCGLNRKYVKAYLSHIKQCDGKDVSTQLNASKNKDIDVATALTPTVKENIQKCDRSSLEVDTESTTTPSFKDAMKCTDSPTKVENNSEKTLILLSEKVTVNCGVCRQVIEDSFWNDHIQKEHNYLAWKEAESPIDLQDDDQIWQHLHLISKKCDGLVCPKCGLNRKYVKAYLSHIKQCDGMNDSIESDSSKNVDIDNATPLTTQVKEKIEKCGSSSLQVNTKSALSPSTKELSVECGVCKQKMDNSLWNDHIQKEHNYLAWKEGESSLDLQDKDQIWQHLHSISKKVDGLVCANCGLNRKYVKAYLSHIKQCDGTTRNNASLMLNSMNTSCTSEVNTSQAETSDLLLEIKCGVCSETCLDKDWIIHIQSKHDYLAWKEGETPLNLQDQESIENHLRSIIKNHGSLYCWNCGVERKYGTKAINQFLQHIDTSGIYMDTEIKDKNPILNPLIPSETVLKCGVCEQEVEGTHWINHIGCSHNYLAWKHGKKPLDMEDIENVKLHFCKLSKQVDALKCSKCGFTTKYPKLFIDHLETCDGNASIDSSKTTELTECAVCSKKMNPKDWKLHAMKKHYNVAWRVGDQPIDLKSNQVVEKLLKEYKQVKGVLVCKVCGISRASLIGFYAHVVICGKSEEEAKEFQNVCEICNKVYVCVYKYQHMMGHRELIYRKQQLEKLKEENEGTTETTLDTTGDGNDAEYQKRAAIKTRDVIDKSKTNETLNNDSLVSNSMNTSCTSNESQMEVEIKCGVCSETCLNRDWIMHIHSKHDYLAWKEGETPLNLQDQEAIENHLLNIIKYYGSLYCRNCGMERKYGKRAINTFLEHIDTCGKDTELKVDDKNPILSSPNSSESAVVRCGVCKQDIEGTQWIEHIGCSHNYLAWKHGEQPLDLEDTENVKLHFSKLSRHVDAFKCANCGFRKKYPKLFIDHIGTCNVDASSVKNTELIQCAVCSNKMKTKEWRSHAMDKHYNVAWRVGDRPIDLKSCYAVEKYLKEYKQVKGVLVCKVCGISRVSLIGFYAHVLICGKSGEELDEYQNICEICNKPYVCVYKNQHMTAHREQEYAKERKIQRLEKEKEDNELMPETHDTTGDQSAVGRRRAAVKARNVIEKLKTDDDEQNNTCATCGFEAATARKLARHQCVNVTYESGSDTDDSYESDEPNASDETDSSNHDSDVSEEEEKAENMKKKRYKESIVTAKVPNFPFKYNKLDCYTNQSKEDFFKIHFTDEILFPEWRNCKYELLEISRLTDYLPKVEQSCKIKLEEKWETFSRFQVKKFNKGCSIFLGGSVKCLSWIPPRLNEDDQSGNYLAVSCHQDTDTPRYNFDELSTHSGVIQIWNFDTFNNALPKVVLCIAHDYGTVWAMDWCPSGVRDTMTDETCPRLGLLAVACSNGFVYVFSVPYPSSITESGKIFSKLKPVAELRISMSSERKVYQPTALSWSKQKGHAVIFVGYADGTTALYDLCSTMPLLKSIENGVTVIYPYHDRRDHNVCITDVDICPSYAVDLVAQPGALCSTSLAGSAALLRPRAGQPRLDHRSPANLCKFTPGWPSVLLAPEDTIATQSPNELDWYGCARRLGSIRALCTCHHCSRVLVYTRPLLRYIDALPPYTDFKKQTIALIKTTPLAKKRKIANDELAMLVEPLTYDEVVKQYGVDVTVFNAPENNPSVNSMRDTFTERFPLADVTSLAFCAARAHHRIAAVGLHAGFVLILTV